MSHQHAKPDPIAEAEAIRADADESDEVTDPRLLQLFLDSDGRYRWYEEEEPTPASSDSLLDAIEQGENFYESFQIVEIRGEPMQPDTHIDDVYAEDELEESEREAAEADE